MKTVKVIHYPEGGNKTTEIFEAETVKIVEGYLHEVVPEGFIVDPRFGARMDLEKPHKYWVTLLYLNDASMLAGLNSRVYVMVDGKTVASYESIIID